MSSVRKSLFVGFAQNYGTMIFQLAASIFVARLLAPSELGIYSVSAVLVGLAQEVRAFGVPTYIIQEKELTEGRIRSAMGVAILVGWLLAGVIALLSGPAADFYGEPGVRGVMLVLALNFLLMPFGSVTMAYLVRNMNFVPQALGNVASAAVQCAIAVGLAFLGFSYMSLAWASVASTVVMIVVAQFYRPSHMPYRPSLREAKRVARFGVMSTSALVVGDVGQGAPDLIIGRMINMEAVALLGRANSLVQMFDKVVMNAVWRVAMPYFSLNDRDGGNVRGAFLKSVSFVTVLAWPFFLFRGSHGISSNTHFVRFSMGCLGAARPVSLRRRSSLKPFLAVRLCPNCHWTVTGRLACNHMDCRGNGEHGARRGRVGRRGRRRLLCRNRGSPSDLGLQDPATSARIQLSRICRLFAEKRQCSGVRRSPPCFSRCAGASRPEPCLGSTFRGRLWRGCRVGDGNFRVGTPAAGRDCQRHPADRMARRGVAELQSTCCQPFISNPCPVGNVAIATLCFAAKSFIASYCSA